MPSLDFELDVFKQNYTFIAGLDEVGRGTIAGPVVSGAVVLDLNKHLEFYEEINDNISTSLVFTRCFCFE